MNVDELFPRKYVSGSDFIGKPVTLTVARAVMEEMWPPPNARPQKKLVLYFEQTEKGIIVSSRTLAYQIADVTGSRETADWIGRRITFYPVSMVVAGQNRVAIRARAPGRKDEDIPEALHDNGDEV